LLADPAILNVQGEVLPVVVHRVQRQFQRMQLHSWPDEDHRSKLVLITRDLDPELLENWLRDDRLTV